MANSAVVGILKALLEADTAQFSAKMAEASADVKELGDKLQKDLEPRQRAVNAAVRDFLGAREIQKAEEYALALGKLDSINQLVEADQRKVNRVMTEAIAHYTALGQQAPAHFLRLQQETQRTATFSEDLRGKLAALGPSFLSSAGSFALGFLSVQTLVGGFKALAEFAQDCVKSFLDAEAANKKIDASLRATGAFTPTLAASYRQLASDMEGVTVNSDDLNAEAIALFTTFGVGEDQMREALQAAADLAAGLNIDLLAAVTLVSKALDGNVGALQRNNVHVKEATDKGEQFKNVIEAIHRQFEGRAAAEIETTAGKVQQLANAWDNVMEAVGAVIVQSTPFQIFLHTTTESMKTQADGIDDATAAYARYLEMRARIGKEPVHGGLGQDVFLGEDIAGPIDPGSRFDLDRKVKELSETIKGQLKFALVDLGHSVEYVSERTGVGVDVLKRYKETLKETTKETKTSKDATWERAEAEAALKQALMNTFDVFKLPGRRVTLGPSPTELEATEKLIMDQQLYTAFLDESIRRLQDEHEWIRKVGEASEPIADIFNKLPGQRVNLPDPPDPKPYRDTAEAAGLVSDVLGDIATSFSDMPAGAAIATRLIQGYFAALSTGMQASAAAAQLAWGAATFGISFAVGKIIEQQVNISRSNAAGRAEFAQLQADILAFGATPITVLDAKKLYPNLSAAIAHTEALRLQLRDLQEQAEKTKRALLEVGGSGKTWQELEALAEELGIDVKKLGPAFEALRLDELGHKYVDAWQTFKKAGTDNLVVLRGMKDEINAWLKDAQNAGIKIPEYMRPILQALADDGELTDAAGQKLKDLSSLEFEPNLEKNLGDVATSIGDLEGAIRDLIAVLTGDLTKAITDIPAIDIPVRFTLPKMPQIIADGVESPSGLEMPTFSAPGAGGFAGEAAPSLASSARGDFVMNVNGREFYRATMPDFVDELKKNQVTR